MDNGNELMNVMASGAPWTARRRSEGETMAKWLLVITEITNTLTGGYITHTISDVREYLYVDLQDCKEAARRNNEAFERVQHEHPSNSYSFAQCIPNYHVSR